MTAATMPAKVRPGDETPWGIATVLCATNPSDFRWACATHEIASFGSSFALTQHVDDDHDQPCRIAMRCRTDGETHGFRP